MWNREMKNMCIQDHIFMRTHDFWLFFTPTIVKCTFTMKVFVWFSLFTNSLSRHCKSTYIHELPYLLLNFERNLGWHLLNIFSTSCPSRTDLSLPSWYKMTLKPLKLLLCKFSHYPIFFMLHNKYQIFKWIKKKSY